MLTVVPRLLFDGWNGKDFMQLFSEDARSEKLLRVIVETVKVRDSI